MLNVFFVARRLEDDGVATYKYGPVSLPAVPAVPRARIVVNDGDGEELRASISDDPPRYFVCANDLSVTVYVNVVQPERGPMPSGWRRVGRRA